MYRHNIIDTILDIYVKSRQLLRHSSPEFPRSPAPSALSGQSPPMWFAKGEQPARSKNYVESFKKLYNKLSVL